MFDWLTFGRLLEKYARKSPVHPEDVLFGSGLNLSSIGFTEFIMALEEEFDTEIDIDGLDASIVTAGQLHARLNQSA